MAQQHYYAVRYKSVPDPKHIRIEKASSPESAFRLAFGHPPALVRGVKTNAEYKDLGTRVEVIRSDKKRIALLKNPEDWITFPKQQ